jgi:signal transduction histidine kinase
MIQLTNLRITFLLNIIIMASLCSGGCLLAQETSPTPKPKHVVAIFVFKEGLPFAFYMEESLRTALASDSSYPIKLDVEHADRTRFPEQDYLSKLIDLYKYKYRKKNVDLVLALGDESTELILEYGKDLFGDIPMVLVKTEQKSLPVKYIEPNTISVEWGFDFEKTGTLIQNLFPKTKNLYVISGTSITDKTIQNLAVQTFEKLDAPFSIHYLDDLSGKELLLKVTHLPEDSVILFLTFFRDINDEYFVPREMVSQVAEKSNVPTFGSIDLYLGRGIIGGNLVSAETQGKRFAELSKEILKGNSQPEHDSKEKGNQLLFDWRQLKRWSIDEDKLPAGSIVRYRELSNWDEHKKEIIGSIVIIVSQAFALLIMTLQSRKRRLAEEEAQKLRDERAHISRVLSMGEIAASLAHELNQPLSAIRSYAQAAQRFLHNNPPDLDDAGNALHGIISGNRRAEEVIKRIRMALKKEPFKQSPLDVKEMIHEVCLLIHRKANEQNISLKFDLAIDLPQIFGDHIQLQQVLFNLILNGIESMDRKVLELHTIVIHASKENSKTVIISIKDNGIGIDERQENILFDAFYTTKTEGMGIGLSISRSIIEDHGGRLWATKNSKNGTTFSFTVPIYKQDNNEHT